MENRRTTCRMNTMTSLFPVLLSVAVTFTTLSCSQFQAPQQPPAPPTNKKEEPKATPPAKKRLKPNERGSVSSISLTKLFELQQTGNILIYDARPSVLFRQGHIPGAINMPKSICDDVIQVRQPELKAAKAAGKQIVVYCSGTLCADARTVAHHLASAGYSSSTFSGGWDEWKAAELPTE